MCSEWNNKEFMPKGKRLAELSPDFSPRVWKGGASAPPLQCRPYDSDSRDPHRLRLQSVRVAGQANRGSRDFGGLKPGPSGDPPKRSIRGETCRLVVEGDVEEGTVNPPLQ